jgi:hypothetical protein
MRLMLITDGTSVGTRVVNADIPDMVIEGVTFVNFTIEAGHTSELTLRLKDVPVELTADVTNSPTCEDCGGKDWHHTVDCYLGNKQ